MNNYNLDDMTNSFRELVDAIGMEATVALCRSMGGLVLYIPKIDAIERAERNKKIAAEFNGSNHALLAIKYNLSDRQIRGIIDIMRTPALTIEDFLPSPEEDK